MSEPEGITVKLAELLKHPDDLDKIPALKSEFARKKAAIDSQLKVGLKEQLEVTNNGMLSISDGQRIVGQIKEEMMKIDRLCAEAQGMIQDFPNINVVAQTHRNFSQVEQMKSNLESFNDRVAEVERLQRLDKYSSNDTDEEYMPNLLPIHLELSKLRTIREEAMEQIGRAEDTSLQGTLEDYFFKLDEVSAAFDQTLETLCFELMGNVVSGNNGIVVRMAIIIEEEEKNDKKVIALNTMRAEHENLASRLKALGTGSREIRGYKQKMLKSIKSTAEEQIKKALEIFRQKPDKLGFTMRWFFNDLNAVKVGLSTLTPKSWKIGLVYGKIYHELMHDTLLYLIDKDETLNTQHDLAIIDWIKPYYDKMRKLGFDEDQLTPHVIDDRHNELVRRWWQKIVDTMNTLIRNSIGQDEEAFRNRGQFQQFSEGAALYQGPHFVEVWRMFDQMVNSAIDGNREEIVDAVVDAFFDSYRMYQLSWEERLNDACKVYVEPSGASQDSDLWQTQDYLIAISNDQLSVVDKDRGMLLKLQKVFQGKISKEYEEIKLPLRLDQIQNESLDLGFHCSITLVQTIFQSVLRSTFITFFTESWIYADSKYLGMPAVLFTLQEYFADYEEHLHPDMFGVFQQEVVKSLLMFFLQAVRNKGVKFRRDAPFAQRLREDVVKVFEFFNTSIADPVAAKNTWKPVEPFTELLLREKAQLPDIYENLWQIAPDVKFTWVEAVIKSRDDWDRATLSAVRNRANSMPKEIPFETALSRLK
ncbi:MAG: SNARE-binding exocyst subunit S6 [Vezdaea aestivalis]|nr:MAG: SNARE-binding exocyst subunit S6 [Vezdaea aestivalis]